MGKFSEKALLVKKYVEEHESDGITANDIAEALGLSAKSVNATLTAAFTNHKEETGEEVDGKKVKEVKPLMVRIPGEIEDTDEDTGKKIHKSVKFIEFTDYGRTYDYEA